MSAVVNAVRQSPFASAYKNLVDRGYSVLPIVPYDKYPATYRGGRWWPMDNWPDYKTTPAPPFMLALWKNQPDSNIGVVLGTPVTRTHELAAFDFDTDIPDLLETMERSIPTANVRKRGRRGYTGFYLIPKGTRGRKWFKNKIVIFELLTGTKTRQTVVPPSIHPDTDQPYTYISRGTLEDTNIADLVELNEDDLERFYDTLDHLGATEAKAVDHAPINLAGEKTPHRALNDLAYANLEKWVPKLGLHNLKAKPGGGYSAVAAWRPSGTGRPLRERANNLSIDPKGSYDFGKSKGYTAINLVMAARGADTDYAYSWLCEQLGVSNEDDDFADTVGKQLSDDSTEMRGPVIAATPAGDAYDTETGEVVPSIAIDPPAATGALAMRASVGAAQGLAQPDTRPGSIFDPWAEFIVPPFPTDVLPDIVREFIESQSVAIGCDKSGLAMAALVNFSGALDHRFRLRMLANGSWAVSPALWAMLIGPPSHKKTPLINEATHPLESHENAIRDTYDADLTIWSKCGDKKAKIDPPPAPPRFLVSDTTTEKLAEILARHDRGALLKRDELAGWIASMEKYGKGSGADRAFWLQSFDGGSYIVDRVGRGEFRVPNLSVSILGGIQPARLVEIKGLCSDGLLQRFIPVMLGPSSFPLDAPTGNARFEYGRLTKKLIAAKPFELAFAHDALPTMESLRLHLHELEQASGGLATGFQGFVGKLPGLAGRLALVLHAARHPDLKTVLVCRETVEAVHRLVVDFILPHAVEFYRSAETVTDGDRLQKLASYIVTSGKKRLLPSDLTTNIASFRGLNQWEVHQRVSPLVAAGWLEQEGKGPVATAWTVLPQVHVEMAERARTEEDRKQKVAALLGSPRKAGRRN